MMLKWFWIQLTDTFWLFPLCVCVFVPLCVCMYVCIGWVWLFLCVCVCVCVWLGLGLCGLNFGSYFLLLIFLSIYIYIHVCVYFFLLVCGYSLCFIQRVLEFIKKIILNNILPLVWYMDIVLNSLWLHFYGCLATFNFLFSGIFKLLLRIDILLLGACVDPTYTSLHLWHSIK